ncbi:hypothetical protein FA15DRAFT_661014 [Coprinopsis marcescibilis]|uniref:Uncharacterized protein n=1 Tax=Coprinopsis marcescibilis TaxID=230819 RepID=A0A5C3KDJ1_COPMA|nr:hypothetical protein FA15DRAFT_661014 [Coprinopsis marcescibilis]
MSPPLDVQGLGLGLGFTIAAPGFLQPNTYDAQEGYLCTSRDDVCPVTTGQNQANMAHCVKLGVSSSAYAQSSSVQTVYGEHTDRATHCAPLIHMYTIEQRCDNDFLLSHESLRKRFKAAMPPKTRAYILHREIRFLWNWDKAENSSR